MIRFAGSTDKAMMCWISRDPDRQKDSQRVGKTLPKSRFQQQPGSDSPNIVARFRSADSTDQALVLTTPVSGWFNCAGERGCGIAIALILAEKLSAHCNVDLLLASGHELGFAGISPCRDV